MRKIFRILWKCYLYLCALICTLALGYFAYLTLSVLKIPRHHVQLPNGMQLASASDVQGDAIALVAPDGRIVVPPEVVAVQWNAHYVSGLRDFPRPNDPEGRTQEIRFIYKVGDASAIENQPENRDTFMKLDKQSGLKLSSGLIGYADLENDPKYVRYDDGK